MEKLKIQVGSTQIHLSGAEIVAPVKGCRRHPAKDQGETCEEKIDVILHGLPEVLDDWLKMIEALFSRVSLGEQAFITLKLASNLQSYESKIISASLELLGKGTMDLKRGGMGASLVIIRDNIWEGEETSVPLTNVNGTKVTSGLTMHNQYDPGNVMVNFATIDGVDIDGEIPAPATVKITNTDMVVLKSLADIIVSNEIIYNLETGDHWLDGSQASSQLNYGVVMNAAASCGAYCLVQWESTIGLQIVSWVISNERAARFAGRNVRPIMRMHNWVTTDDYWIRCKVKQGDAIQYSRWQKIKSFEKMQILPAVHIPPRDLKSSQISGVIFALEVQRNVAGSHSLAIDDIDILPVDGYRHYFIMGDLGLMPNDNLVDELSEDLIYSIEATTQSRALTHQAAGKGIWLMPGENQCIRIKYASNDHGCIPSQKVALKLSYRPRRKNI